MPRSLRQAEASCAHHAYTLRNRSSNWDERRLFNFFWGYLILKDLNRPDCMRAVRKTAMEEVVQLLTFARNGSGYSLRNVSKGKPDGTSSPAVQTSMRGFRDVFFFQDSGRLCRTWRSTSMIRECCFVALGTTRFLLSSNGTTWGENMQVFPVNVRAPYLLKTTDD